VWLFHDATRRRYRERKRDAPIPTSLSFTAVCPVFLPELWSGRPHHVAVKLQEPAKRVEIPLVTGNVKWFLLPTYRCSEGKRHVAAYDRNVVDLHCLNIG
jgi:hypothetical protein